MATVVHSCGGIYGPKGSGQTLTSLREAGSPWEKSSTRSSSKRHTRGSVCISERTSRPGRRHFWFGSTFQDNDLGSRGTCSGFLCAISWRGSKGWDKSKNGMYTNGVSGSYWDSSETERLDRNQGRWFSCRWCPSILYYSTKLSFRKRNSEWSGMSRSACGRKVSCGCSIR